LDYSLASNKNSGQKIPSSGWHPRPINPEQHGLKPPPLMMSPKKKRNPKLFIYFLMQTRRLATSFEGFNSSLAQWSGKLWNCQVAWK